MATPFDTQIETTVVPATSRQISFALVPLLNDRDWASSKLTKHVERAAVLKLVITWAMSPMAESTPAEVSRVINSTVGQRGEYGDRVNAILAHLASKSDNRNRPELYKPLTKSGASKLIDWLYTLDHVQPVGDVKPGATVPESTSPEVPAGRYALDTQETALWSPVNTIAFYKVDRPTEGKWAGYVFVKLLVGDDEQRLSRSQSEAVLKRIVEAGPEQAAARYGHEIGRCGMCHATLTNDESRARGIGPVCAAKAGW